MSTKYKLKLPRNLYVVSTLGRKTSPFKDQRKGRGGSQNAEADYREEYEEARLSEETESELADGS